MLHPIFAHKVFFTHDGAAHLYNSRIIQSFLTGNGAFYETFFKFNTIPEPNWTGHALLIGLLFFFKPFVAEKIVVTIYVAGFCLGFRYWITAFQPKSSWASFLIFPFVYSFPLHVGFFNFCLGIVVCFFIAGYWIRNAQHANGKKSIVLFLLFFLAYFTHITTFVVTLIFVGTYTLAGIFTEIRNSRINFINAALLYKNVLLAMMPMLLFSISFFVLHGNKNTGASQLSNKWESLFNISPITIFDTVEESKYSLWISYCLMVLVLIAFIKLFFTITNSDGKYRLKKNVPFSQKGNIHLPLVLFFGLLYFILPNEMASGGFVSVRLSLLLFVVLVVWISTISLPKKLIVPLVVICLVSLSHLFAYRDQWATIQNKFVSGLMEVSEHVPEGSVVMPLVESEHWFFLHASNYLGAEKKLLVLDNYEAEVGYFPLLWKNKNSPATYFSEPMQHTCGEQFKRIENDYKVDIILHYNDSITEPWQTCDITMHQILQTEYENYHTSKNGKWKLYKKKPNDI